MAGGPAQVKSQHPNTLFYTEVIITDARTFGKKGISHKEMHKSVLANSKLNPGFMEVEKIVTKTVEVFEINNQDESSSQDFFYPAIQIPSLKTLGNHHLKPCLVSSAPSL